MSRTTRRTSSRLLVGFGAVLGLVVATAAPAAADLPFGEDIRSAIVGGEINVGDQTFLLGDDADPNDPTDCNPDEDPSFIDATVGEEVGGEADLTDFSFTFQPGTEIVDFPIFGDTVVCLQIVVLNEATLVGQLTEEANGDGTVHIPDVEVRVLIEDELGLLGSNCRLDQIDVGDIDGTIEDGNPPWDSTLTAGIPDPFDVDETTGCNFSSLVNDAIGVPGDGDATFVLSVDLR